MIRKKIKILFDGIVYRYPFINFCLRNLNKAFSGLISFRLRPYGVLKIKLEGGVRFRLATNETSSVTKLLFWNGAEGYEYTTIFKKIIPSCKVFLDVGANIGYYSILAAIRNPSVKVFAFEPASAPFYYLKKNVALNELTERLKIFKVALAEKNGNINFFEFFNPDAYHTPYNLGGAGTTKKLFESQQRTRNVQVPCQTLDHFCEENKLIPDLIKLDTEGTENFILMGGVETLKRCKPIVICETLFHVIEEELETIMKGLGYEFYNFYQGKLTKAETLKRKTDNGVRDCFFIHPDKYDQVKIILP